jgi:hypothetical protein
MLNYNFTQVSRSNWRRNLVSTKANDIKKITQTWQNKWKKPDALLGNVRYKRHLCRSFVLWQGDLNYRLARRPKTGSGTNKISITLIGLRLSGRRKNRNIHNRLTAPSVLEDIKFYMKNWTGRPKRTDRKLFTEVLFSRNDTDDGIWDDTEKDGEAKSLVFNLKRIWFI